MESYLSHLLKPEDFFSFHTTATIENKKIEVSRKPYSVKKTNSYKSIPQTEECLPHIFGVKVNFKSIMKERIGKEFSKKEVTPHLKVHLKALWL